MKCHFVHISDIHYRPNWAEEVGVVSQAFIADATEHTRQLSPYLVVSGDLIAKGGHRDALQGFRDHFLGSVSAMGIPRERRIFVPGNHDVSQSVLEPNLQVRNAALDSINGEVNFNDHLSHLTTTYFRPAFSDYLNLESETANFGCSRNLGGAGADLGNGIAIYCLNTALTSSAGLDAPGNDVRPDRGSLMVDTRALHAWLRQHDTGLRILVMHHPPDWLAPWAKRELEAVMPKFHLSMLGHIHEPSAKFSSQNGTGFVTCVAPALFTSKHDTLGYSIVTIDTDAKSVTITYRQWSSVSRQFVKGTVLAGNDAGSVTFDISQVASASLPVPPSEQARLTLEVLTAEFESAAICYASRRALWVERDLADMPETAASRASARVVTETQFAAQPQSCVIRAPRQHGLSALARRIALEHHRQSQDGAVLLVVGTSDLPADEKGLKKHIESRCRVLAIHQDKIAGFIFDAWDNSKHAVRVAKAVKRLQPHALTIVLRGIDDSSHIETHLRLDDVVEAKTLYLWALSRQRIRQLTELYVENIQALDEAPVTERIVSDLDALNIQRTPMNCLLLLKCAEDAFEDTPVNRTALIERVLFLLFHQFDRIPRYGTKPDVKDCEYCLGYLSELLIRKNQRTFTKETFLGELRKYSEQQLIQIDVSVLFGFLVSENIVVARGGDYVFRFTYWLHFFAAHRMHHNREFRSYILQDRRYAAFPELLEFYAGIDRRRGDAIEQLASDLRIINAEFVQRTGIPSEFDPFQLARWEPKPEELALLWSGITGAAAESALPVSVKDAIADKSYDPGRPYQQELAEFMHRASYVQLVEAMKGCARALRNSDYVEPHRKKELLDQVVTSCTHICRVLAVISPILAKEKRAVFEDAQFYLGDGFKEATYEKLWEAIMNCVLENVVEWHQEDVCSKKMGPLLANYVAETPSRLARVLLVMVMIRQRPHGWEAVVEKFLQVEDRNSFYMAKVFGFLRYEFRHGFGSERVRQEILRLAAIALARHEVGVKWPNQRLIEKAERSIEEASREDPK